MNGVAVHEAADTAGTIAASKAENFIVADRAVVESSGDRAQRGASFIRWLCGPGITARGSMYVPSQSSCIAHQAATKAYLFGERDHQSIEVTQSRTMRIIWAQSVTGDRCPWHMFLVYSK